MQIEVVSDIVCPWCYVGKRRLKAALAERPALGVSVSWLPFEVNPQLPEEGMPRDAYLLERFGDTQRFAAAQAQLIELGRPLGIDFRFDGDRHMPNTRASHMLLRAAARVDSERGTALQSALQERLMAGYFTRGENLSRRETLIEAAHEAGLAIEQAERALADVTLRTEVASIERELQSLGVSSVPTFIFARRFAFSGAQEVPVFLEALDEAARDGH